MTTAVEVPGVSAQADGASILVAENVIGVTVREENRIHA